MSRYQAGYYQPTEAEKEQNKQTRSAGYNLPNLCKLMDDKHIKLYLQHCKVVVTLAGTRCVVAKTYGAGYYGRFKGTTFLPNKECTTQIIDELEAVEEKGLAALNAIGLLTGNCCICGRTLVAEESIDQGIGPICAGKVGWHSEVQL